MNRKRIESRLRRAFAEGRLDVELVGWTDSGLIVLDFPDQCTEADPVRVLDELGVIRS